MLLRVLLLSLSSLTTVLINATSVNWDFGDGNNSTERNPIHEYLAPGIYTVNLTAINGNGTDSKLATITVSEKPAQYFLLQTSVPMLLRVMLL